MSGDGRLEAAQYLFRLVVESPSQMSFGGGIVEKEETNIFKTPIIDRAEGANTGPLFQIIFLEGGEE